MKWKKIPNKRIIICKQRLKQRNFLVFYLFCFLGKKKMNGCGFPFKMRNNFPGISNESFQSAVYIFIPASQMAKSCGEAAFITISPKSEEMWKVNEVRKNLMRKKKSNGYCWRYTFYFTVCTSDANKVAHKMILRSQSQWHKKRHKHF